MKETREDALLLTIPMAMQKLSIGRNQIYRLFEVGALKKVKIGYPPGDRSGTRISRAELEILVELARAGQGLFDPAVIDQMKALRGEPLEESSSSSPSEESASGGR